MQFWLPHEASTTCPAGTAPWASIQFRRRRLYAVDGLAISSQSPSCFVGENFPIANQTLVRTHSPGSVHRRPAAAPLVLLPRPARAQIVPTDLGSVASR